jgi:hypothetical protein
LAVIIGREAALRKHQKITAESAESFCKAGFSFDFCGRIICRESRALMDTSSHDVLLVGG